MLYHRWVHVFVGVIASGCAMGIEPDSWTRSADMGDAETPLADAAHTGDAAVTHDGHADGGSPSATSNDAGQTRAGTTVDSGQTTNTQCTPGAQRACYDGPAGTENVGICQAGTQLCDSAGEWGTTCTGEVTPTGPSDCTSTQPTPPPPTDPCAANTDCTSCGTSSDRCGWCADSSSCHGGSSHGRATNRVAPRIGSGTRGLCSSTGPSGTGPSSDPCSAYSDCTSCADSAGCGFCEDDNTCRSGDENGPSASSCVTFWDWTSDTCL